MDSDGKELNTYNLICWIKRQENPLFNRNYKRVLADKKILQGMSSSPVIGSRTFKSLRRPTAVQTQFLLAPLPQTQCIHANVTSEDGSNGTKYATTLSGVNMLHEINKGTFNAVQKNKIEFVSLLLSYGRSPSPFSERDISKSDMGDVHDTLSERSSLYTPLDTPLPAFPRSRTPTKDLLLRRPTIDKVEPLFEDDELFVALSKQVDLKALPFRKTAESFKFYETHYPLILTKIALDGERCVTPSKRARTPESPMSMMIQRQRNLNKRLVDLEYMMETMERETEDCAFVTELYSDTFNPTTWRWNKIDTAGLRRRYTIDASLREMH